MITDLGIWNRQKNLGYVFSSSTLFQLPNGAWRSPDAAWISKERWDSLSPEQRRKFPPITPDFVIELRSATDSLSTLSTLRRKLEEYIDVGVQLGWLIDPQSQQVEVYGADGSVSIHPLPIVLGGDPVLPGFTLALERYPNEE